MEWYRTRQKLVEASTLAWNQMECDWRKWKKEKDWWCQGHVWSLSWHYPPVNISSLVWRFWCLCDRECGGSWDGCHRPDRLVRLCIGGGESCIQFHCVPMSSIIDIVIWSGTPVCHEWSFDTTCIALVSVWTLGIKGPWWHPHWLRGCVGEGTCPWVVQ